MNYFTQNLSFSQSSIQKKNFQKTFDFTLQCVESLKSKIYPTDYGKINLSFHEMKKNLKKLFHGK